jgi:hypothetical protein
MKETLEEAAEKLYPINNTGSMFMPSRDELNNSYKQEAFIEGVKWQEQRMFKLHDDWQEYTKANFHPEFSSVSFKSYVEQFKK